MATFHASRTGVWDIDSEQTELPELSISNLKANSIIKVTCQFFGRSETDDLGHGYTYRISEDKTNLITLTPDIGFIQGTDSWQLYTHVMLFQVPTSADGKNTSISVKLDSGDMNGAGAMMNFVMIAEVSG